MAEPTELAKFKLFFKTSRMSKTGNEDDRDKKNDIKNSNNSMEHSVQQLHVLSIICKREDKGYRERMTG